MADRRALREANEVLERRARRRRDDPEPLTLLEWLGVIAFAWLLALALASVELGGAAPAP